MNKKVHYFYVYHYQASDAGPEMAKDKTKFITVSCFHVNYILYFIRGLLQDSGIDLLKLRPTAADKYALQLMDILFTDEEMGRCVYKRSKRSNKPGLDPLRVNLLEGMYFDMIMIALDSVYCVYK